MIHHHHFEVTKHLYTISNKVEMSENDETIAQDGASVKDMGFL